MIGPPVYQPTPRCVLVPDRRCFHAARGYGRSDGDGNPIQIALDLRWAAAEPFARSKVSGNGWFPAEEKRDARVHTFSHGLSSSAVAQGSIVVDGTRIDLAATGDATLEQIRYFCQVIQHPHGGFDVDC